MTRWIVDAMNVIGSRPDKWWNDPKKAMREMAVALNDFASRTGNELTVVFDTDPGPRDETPDIEVVIARRKGRNAADYEIEQLGAGDEEPGSLRVVTSDKRLVEKVTGLGAKVTGSSKFRAQLDRQV